MWRLCASSKLAAFAEPSEVLLQTFCVVSEIWSLERTVAPASTVRASPATLADPRKRFSCGCGGGAEAGGNDGGDCGGGSGGSCDDDDGGDDRGGDGG